MIISTIFLAIAACCWAIMSHYTFHNRVRDELSFWGKESWKRKYKRYPSKSESDYTLIAAPNTWYYRLFRLRYKEKFPLSATALVFTTDGYHLMQWIGVKAILAAITINPLYYMILWVTWLAVFNVTYISKKTIVKHA